MARDKKDDKGKDADEGDDQAEDAAATDELDGDEAEDGDGSKKGKKKGKKDKDGPDEPPSARKAYIGLGLIVSLVVGFAPLSDAVSGNGSFETAMVRFVACLVVCSAAGSVLGRLIDNAPPPPDEELELVRRRLAAEAAEKAAALGDGTADRPAPALDGGLDRDDRAELPAEGDPAEVGPGDGPSGLDLQRAADPAVQELPQG